jgi:hypothetical protein
MWEEWAMAKAKILDGVAWNISSCFKMAMLGIFLIELNGSPLGTIFRAFADHSQDEKNTDQKQ